ncbi:MAG TPA: replicative DNA helicase, partial [Candidatus Coatesbacteria bacterium]|nr:replicative DNA helicase [Candidatus Coatesbacteria bacterium]
QDTVDLVTVSDELKRSPEGLSDAELGELVEVRESTASTAGLGSHLEIIQDKAILRSLVKAAAAINESARADADPPARVLEKAEGLILEIAERRMRREVKPLGELVDVAIEEFRAFQEERSVKSEIMTGFYDLDELLAGLHRGNLIVLASRPGMGKTALGLNIAQRIAIDSRTGVGFFSLEMSAEELVRRMLCSEARVDSQKVRRGNVSAEDMKRFIAKVARLSNAPFFLDDTPAISVLELRAKARRLVKQKEVRLIVVDYLQLMTASGRRTESRQVEVAEISRSLKALAKELDVPVLAIAQLNRQPANRPRSKLPQLSDLRESGAIEQDADVVMFLHREEAYQLSSPGETEPEEEEDYGNGGGLPDDLARLPGISQVIVAKQRNGPVGSVYLVFRKRFMRFENLDRSFRAPARSSASGEAPPF